MRILTSSWFPIIFGLLIVVVILGEILCTPQQPEFAFAKKDAIEAEPQWYAPDINSLPANEEGSLIRYGRDLIANTAKYLGPKGIVASVSNGMNCQNCHIDAGAKSYANALSAVASIYPVYRPRSGIVESIEFRVNDCMKRSLNGQTIDSLGREMKAMVAYMKWIGKDVPKGVKPPGSGTVELPFLDRAANVEKGRIVYDTKCLVCHGKSGQGQFTPDSNGFIYPPLWGPRSYNTGAGLYRLTRFAGYVKYSMPFGASHENPLLSDEEAWDVAAFVNSQPRPQKYFKEDWPDISKKAIDHPYGPYKDSFSTEQHKYGPFGPIKKAREQAVGKTIK